MPSILESLPKIYQHLLPSLEAEIPSEDKATCSNCAMCESNCGALSQASNQKTFFEPNAKCCTFHPSLPNYLIGAILLDHSSESAIGRSRILEKISSRIGVTPYGVAAPAKYSLLYGHSSEFFGRSLSMRCPYYIEENGGLCAVWKNREAVCSTYFCKHVAGADGRRFWMSLKSYLANIEYQLSRYAIFKLYPDYLLAQKHPAEPPARKLDREELEDRTPSSETYTKLWSTWATMEKEFYEECFHLVNSLTPDDVKSIMGLEGTLSEATLAKNREAVTAPKLPSKLRMNSDLKIKWLTSGEVVMGGYSELDALALPANAYQMLLEFNGEESTQAVREKLRREKQSDFSDEVLLSLYQHRVLEQI